MSSTLETAVSERIATDKELMAAIAMFEAAAMRADGARLGIATEAAHATLQANLDAIASMYAAARAQTGER